MRAAPPKTANNDWIRFQRDQDTGIESVHAHFRGHAYDPHDHDEVLVGVTQQGAQQFKCHRSLHTSTPGNAILIEPGAVHDGHAAEASGFTYAMLYLPQPWVAGMLQRRGLGDISALEPAFRSTLTKDASLSAAIQCAFNAVHRKEGRLARDQSLDHLIDLLSRHLCVAAVSRASDAGSVVQRARDYLHDQMATDIGLDDLACHSGIDRFRLTRQFKQSFGLSPHAYLVRLRLRTARTLLAQGLEPARVAIQVGFSDQSHLGRWFQRAYRLTPAAYQRRCTNVLDEHHTVSDH
jgi:AraC-like DNA-binding protein